VRLGRIPRSNTRHDNLAEYARLASERPYALHHELLLVESSGVSELGLGATKGEAPPASAAVARGRDSVIIERYFEV
jgi:hypothetical protein